MRRLFLAVALTTSLSCQTPPDPPEENPLSAPPVDTKLAVSARDVLGWGYHRELRADLNGDGSPEQVVLASDVVMSDRGLPLWEDGHRWAVVVRDGETDTLVFLAFVPNGFVEAAVMTASSEGDRDLWIQERTPAQVRDIAVSYDGPGAGRTVSAAYYQIEQWMPGSARLTE